MDQRERNWSARGVSGMSVGDARKKGRQCVCVCVCVRSVAASAALQAAAKFAIYNCKIAMEEDFQKISDNIPSGVGDVLKKEGFDNVAS